MRAPKIPIPFRPRLRVLLDPIYITAANLHSSSTYHLYAGMARELVSRGHFVFWMLPDVEYTPLEIENHPNVGVIRSAYIQDQFVIDGLFTDKFYDLFNRVAGKYHIDVMCTSRNSLVAYYKRVLDPPRFHDTDGEFTDKGYTLPVVIIEGFPQTRERQHTSRAYWLNQVLGYAASDKTVFYSDHNRSEVVKEMMDVLSIRETQRFAERSLVLPRGVECDELDKIYEPDRWTVEPGFNVISVGRIFGVSYAEFLPWFDYLYQSGIDDATLTISLSGKLSGPMRAKLTKIGFDLNNFGKQFKLYENNPRNNFLRMLRKFHCFICPVSHYDHPMAVFEAMYLGVPGILPVSDYQQTFFKDYPYVIDPKDKAALLATLLQIRNDPAAARAAVLPWRQRIRDLYDAPVNRRRLVDEIEKVARDPIGRYRISAGIIDLIKTLRGRGYSFADVVTYLKSAGRMGVSIGDQSIRQSFTYCRSSIHHAMNMSGFTDPCDSADDRFVRNDVFEEMTKTKPEQTFARKFKLAPPKKG